MALQTSYYMLKKAQEEGYAVPAFNIHNLETLQTVVEVAAEMHSPVMIAATPGTVRHAGKRFLLAMAEAAAETYDIPITLHLDHHEDVADLKESIDMGYPSVMIDASKHAFAKNIEIVKEVVEYAHERGVTVEAELGKLGGREDDLVVSDKDAFLTDPKEAIHFVEKTGVDSLAVAIGTAHGLYKAEPELDYERLTEIKKVVSIPLVLHGASGVPGESVKETIRRGICKVNIATELKIPFSDAMKAYFVENPKANDPRYYMKPAKEAMAAVVREKIEICQSANRA